VETDPAFAAHLLSSALSLRPSSSKPCQPRPSKHSHHSSLDTSAGFTQDCQLLRPHKLQHTTIYTILPLTPPTSNFQTLTSLGSTHISKLTTELQILQTKQPRHQPSLDRLPCLSATWANPTSSASAPLSSTSRTKSPLCLRTRYDIPWLDVLHYQQLTHPHRSTGTAPPQTSHSTGERFPPSLSRPASPE
jgi:hypothetical protein